MSDVTYLFQRIEGGDAQAADELLPVVYAELRQLAAAKMAREAAGHTLQPTALVHEAWLRLGGSAQPSWRSRAHFFAAAAEAMRRILIDHARRRQAQRHGGGQQRLDVDDIELVANRPSDDSLLAVNDALHRLAEVDPPKAELVKLRYFGGLTIPEAAQTLGIAEATANRWWAYARAWLHQEVKRQFSAAARVR
jgi:RNA polymerase sigma factor (TIGR02999 family)